MRVMIFGATGMIGQGVLREALRDQNVEKILSIGRNTLGSQFHPKLEEVIQKNMFDYSNIEAQLKGYDACFFCLGTPSPGKTEEEYSKITYDLTMAAAQALARINPKMTFVYVSGVGADSSEQGSTMWARVRGRLENALFKLPFKHVYVFRPGMVEPQDGIQSRVALYRNVAKILKPVLPALRAAFPNSVSSTRIIGQAMLSVAEQGFDKRIMFAGDFKRAAERRAGH